MSAALKAADLDSRARWVLLVSMGVTALLYAAPYGHYVAYPLVLVSTVVHELGHGLAAWLVGGSFHEFVMFPEGSGWAQTSVGSEPAWAIVSAGGLIGPAVGAALGFVASRRPRSSRLFLGAVGAFLLLMEVLVVRNAFGFLFVGVFAAVCLALSLVRSGRWAQHALIFLSVQLALSVFSRGDYLFTDYAVVDGERRASDVQNMAEVLALPYWFWGALCGAFSVLVLAFGGWFLIRNSSRSGRARGR